jgi:hypothetical protein
VPLVFYGPGFIRKQGEINLGREATLADLAPTVAELIGLAWPGDRPGRAITQALVPPEERPKPPALVLTIVWDGGGWNVLHAWPEAWRALARIIGRGTSVRNVIAGSSPSVTPAIHATIGTGAFPKQHGVVDIASRTPQGVVPYSFPRGSTDLLKIPTLGDLHDLATGNRAQVGMFAFQFFHLGMMGHGASWPGGDRDIAVIAELQAGRVVTRSGDFNTNRRSYRLPDYVQQLPGFETDVATVDSRDGRLDSKWLGSVDLTDPSNVRHSPVWVRYQTRLVEEIVRREGYGEDGITDLFFTNYKEIDDVGHNWNMLEPEMEDVLRYSDAMLERTVRFLNEEVGERRWVIALTADHGQAPMPSSNEAWPIRMNGLRADIARHFRVKAADLMADERPTGLWLRRATLSSEDITQKGISRFLMNYRLEDNAETGDGVPRAYANRRQERLFAAAFPGRRLEDIYACARDGGP